MAYLFVNMAVRDFGATYTTNPFRLYGALTPFRILLLTPSPFIPLPLEKGDKGGRDEYWKRGYAPLKRPLMKRGERILEEGLASLLDPLKRKRFSAFLR